MRKLIKFFILNIFIFKYWSILNNKNNERYRIAKNETKKAVREAKLAAFDDMYR